MKTLNWLSERLAFLGQLLLFSSPADTLVAKFVHRFLNCFHLTVFLVFTSPFSLFSPQLHAYPMDDLISSHISTSEESKSVPVVQDTDPRLLQINVKVIILSVKMFIVISYVRPVYVQRLFIQGIFIQSISSNPIRFPPVGWGKNKPTVFPACRKRRINGSI